MIAKAVVKHQPHVIALPECFNFEYCSDASLVKAVAEPVNDGATSRCMSELSKKFGIFLVGGSIERDGTNLYNTANVWSPSGGLVTRHRKVRMH